jgi:outer membrane protein OmpA-like peptidoglycan-associated protein
MKSMKKLISIFVALMMVFATASAQTVEHSTFFENTSVTLYGGGITTQHLGGEPFFWGGAKNIVKGIRPVAGIELTKYVTPVVGFGIEGLAMFNTTNTNTWVSQSNVVADLKLNLSNWIGGYPGQPRRVEVVFVPGLGWGHDYGYVLLGRPRNYLTYNVGAEMNINLGKERAWQINIKPVAVWNNYDRELGFYNENLQGRLQIGITYKFGSRSKKSHNFVNCPYTVTSAQFDAAVAEADSLYARVQELEKREPKVIEKVVEKQVIVEKQVQHSPALQTVLTFASGSAKLSAVEKAKLGVLARAVRADENIFLVGSADSATGYPDSNYRLAEQRAQAVRESLIKDFGIEADRIYTRVELDTNELPAASRSVIITLE